MTLRFGVPPYRVASLFLDSGEWQAEDVTEETLFHAADRVVAAARAAAALMNGREAVLTAGVYCGWCPRGRDVSRPPWFRPRSGRPSSGPGLARVPVHRPTRRG